MLTREGFCTQFLFAPIVNQASIFKSLRVFSFFILLQITPATMAVEKPLFRGVTIDHNAPYNFEKENRIQGLVFEVADALAKRAGYRLAVEVVPWARAILTAQNEASVLVFSVARTPEREALFHWIGPIVKAENWLYKLESRKDIILKDLQDARPYLVGNVANSSTIPLQKRLGIRIDTGPSDLSNCRKLKYGRVDLVPVDPRGLAAFLAPCELSVKQIEKTIVLAAEDLYIAIGKNTKPEVAARFMSEFDLMVKDKSLEKIVMRWNMKSSISGK
jgi:polar amino acid transport system substrate-binding protein